MKSVFNVNLGNFKGPLELLLDLIQKRKLTINEISLSKVTDDFLKEIEKFPDSLKRSSEFALITSTLLLIKSKSLLPDFEITEEEKQDIDSLQNRLIFYKTIKQASSTLKRNELFFPKNARNIEIKPVFAPGQNLSLGVLYASLRNMFFSLQIYMMPKVSVRLPISVKSAIGKLKKILKQENRTRLSKLSKNKEYMITYFLAALELERKGELELFQVDSSDIEIKKSYTPDIMDFTDIM